MAKFDEITRNFGKIKYMNEARARILRRLIEEQDASDILEIGFFRGKSSLYIGAMLEDRGKGTLTTIDRQSAAKLKPNIHDLLGQAGLAHRVRPIFAYRSFTWEIMKLARSEPRPQFDLCYFDGGHTWDDTGFGFVLVDLLLRPGGTIVFDDVDWSIEHSAAYGKDPKRMALYSEDERAARTVRLVWDMLVPEFGYAQVREIAEVGWAVARKPALPGIRASAVVPAGALVK
jgi:predicted O-methyltransferase YrrM